MYALSGCRGSARHLASDMVFRDDLAATRTAVMTGDPARGLRAALTVDVRRWWLHSVDA
ncbi:hypothetical protein SAMN05421541_1091 [Actinoplanes philippinensis]|uniref:Uncharacterized protein n=1 Tax=Actinoplanes philippinensis TaxID=35752 RepID=A0A1I2HXH1_9ACTN|nr:hypothetical protein SAMN05421541_1091 [Actinoplanes philippinensis]